MDFPIFSSPSSHNSNNIVPGTISSPFKDTTNGPTVVSEIPPRRSTGVKAPPAWLKDYVCPKLPHTSTNHHSSPDSFLQSHGFHSSTHTLYLLFFFSHLAHLLANYVSSLVNVFHHPDPRHYAQARQYPEWVQAINIELDALEQNHTWLLISLPREESSDFQMGLQN